MTTFTVTFLGHQGWMIRTERTTVLVDPLLFEDFGEIHALEYRVYPPRILKPDAFPAIDAVLLSHEHDDHFDIPSLARLDRRIPIYASAHSSIAAFAILREMGFVVKPLTPGVAFPIGDLDVIPFIGDHVSVNCADEWDALPLLIRDKGGAGSFFTSVDVMLVASHIEWAKNYVSKPGLVTWSNNAIDWSHMSDESVRDTGTEQCLRSMGAGHKLIATSWGKPAAMLICAGGFTFTGDRSWFNERLFWVDTEAVCKHMSALYRDERFLSALPGQTFRMEGNRLTTIEESAPFLSVPPRGDWPARGRIERSDCPDYAPATGRRDITEEEREELRERLQLLAHALVGGLLFRSLHSMLAVESLGKKPTFALILRRGDAGATDCYEYNGSACAFVPGVADGAHGAYLAGWECWATDLLAVLRAEIGPITLMFGRARMWNALPNRFRFDLLEGLTRASHPLSCPAQYLKNYERLWEKSKGVVPVIAAKLDVEPASLARA